jgi:predicted GH43/DUF377 family glycosyl hydrolase
MPHSNPIIKQTDIFLSPDNSRVVLRRFTPHPENRITGIVQRILSLPESHVESRCNYLLARFSQRHLDLEKILLEHFESIKIHYDTDCKLSESRKLLIGAYFSNEYSFESAALFNPSIVPHPDQSNLPTNSLRFIMSLRAVGEGHISSLVFRTGVIDSKHHISIDDTSPFAAVAPVMPDLIYNKKNFQHKIATMGFENDYSKILLNQLPEAFTVNHLTDLFAETAQDTSQFSESDLVTRDKILWLALSNYGVKISDNQPLSHWILFPASPTEKNGIEDARFVKFTENDGEIKYYATYTAYDGKVILPQLLETDFKHFKMKTLNGKAATNKGLALFPRRINHHFAMLSRQDNDSISLMYSKDIEHWQDTTRILRPEYDWEFFQTGNCGSPIETSKGWLVITHGVGPFREYSLGAILLDLDDPSKVIGRLAEPLIVPTDKVKGGYVPNVVYTCGCMLHQDQLIIPYALSDLQTTIATVDLNQLLQMLRS